MDVHVALTVLWWCVKPSTIAPASSVLGVGLLASGRRKAGGVSLAVSAFVLLCALVLPTARVLTTVLERRVEPVAELPAAMDGIIVLGGNEVVRLSPFAELAERYPDATLVFSGSANEAASARYFLNEFDGLAERTIFEDLSRNTSENARFTWELVRPEVGELWILVTSAMHAARARRTFEGAAWSVIAYPVSQDHACPRRPSIVCGLGRLDEASREWLATLGGPVLRRTATQRGLIGGDAVHTFGGGR